MVWLLSVGGGALRRCSIVRKSHGYHLSNQAGDAPILCASTKGARFPKKSSTKCWLTSFRDTAVKRTAKTVFVKSVRTYSRWQRWSRPCRHGISGIFSHKECHLSPLDSILYGALLYPRWNKLAMNWLIYLRLCIRNLFPTTFLLAYYLAHGPAFLKL